MQEALHQVIPAYHFASESLVPSPPAEAPSELRSQASIPPVIAWGCDSPPADDGDGAPGSSAQGTGLDLAGPAAQLEASLSFSGDVQVRGGWSASLAGGWWDCCRHSVSECLVSYEGMNIVHAEATSMSAAAAWRVYATGGSRLRASHLHSQGLIHACSAYPPSQLHPALQPASCYREQLAQALVCRPLRLPPMAPIPHPASPSGLSTPRGPLWTPPPCSPATRQGVRLLPATPPLRPMHMTPTRQPAFQDPRPCCRVMVAAGSLLLLLRYSPCAGGLVSACGPASAVVCAVLV